MRGSSLVCRQDSWRCLIVEKIHVLKTAYSCPEEEVLTAQLSLYRVAGSADILPGSDNHFVKTPARIPALPVFSNS